MPRHNHHKIDPATAERLLAGHGGGPPHLSGLLARAARPAHPGELAGEDAAMAAFRSAQLAPASAQRRRIITAHWTRWATVKAAGWAFALTVGGVALAAGTGVLPHPLTIGATTASQTPDATALAASTGAGTGLNSTDPHSTVTPSRSASLHGLCTDYLAHVNHATDKATQNPAFAQLTIAAGGAANVTTYCQSLLNGPSPTTTQEPSKADSHPTGSPHPTEHDPKGKPSQSTQ